jgi:hypothetical protein
MTSCGSSNVQLDRYLLPFKVNTDIMELEVLVKINPPS